MSIESDRQAKLNVEIEIQKEARADLLELKALLEPIAADIADDLWAAVSKLEERLGRNLLQRELSS